MALADEVRSLGDRTMAELIAAHDYFETTKLAWGLARDAIASGRVFSMLIVATGTTITEVALAANARRYIDEQLTEATFQQFLATFENFLADLLRLWLTAYPQSLGKRMVDLKTVLELPDREAVVQFLIGKELLEITYDRPSAWFAYLEGKANLGCPSADEVERIAEAKASRDILAHGKGIANAMYEAKAGRLARFRAGERIAIPGRYHREVWDLLLKVVADVCDAAIAKVS